MSIDYKINDQDQMCHPHPPRPAPPLARTRTSLRCPAPFDEFDPSTAGGALAGGSIAPPPSPPITAPPEPHRDRATAPSPRRPIRLTPGSPRGDALSASSDARFVPGGPLESSSELKKRKRRPTEVLVVAKKKRKLLPFYPSEDPAQRLRLMASLATAFTATGAVFSNDLTYVCGMAPHSANRAALEAGGTQVLPKEDVETLNLCKRMMARVEWPRLLVIYDPRG
ncbi:hypothetical protein ACP70R_001703 [Stipagrostis hirtigluma subsp. patula]